MVMSINFKGHLASRLRTLQIQNLSNNSKGLKPLKGWLISGTTNILRIIHNLKTKCIRKIALLFHHLGSNLRQTRTSACLHLLCQIFLRQHIQVHLSPINLIYMFKDRVRVVLTHMGTPLNKQDMNCPNSLQCNYPNFKISVY